MSDEKNGIIFAREHFWGGNKKKCMTCMFSLSLSLWCRFLMTTQSQQISPRPEIVVGGPLFCAFSLMLLIVVKCNPLVSLY